MRECLPTRASRLLSLSALISPFFFAALDSMYRERGLWVYGRDER